MGLAARRVVPRFQRGMESPLRGPWGFATRLELYRAFSTRWYHLI